MRNVSLILALVSAVSCGGGSPSSPTRPAGGLLDGTWRGTLVIEGEGLARTEGPTVWTLQTISGTSGFQYDARMESQNPWFARSVQMTTTLMPPGTVPAEVHTTGFYASPRGCQGSFYSVTRADVLRMVGSFYGVDCGSIQFTGSVDLSR